MIVSSVPKRTFKQMKAWFNIWAVSTWDFFKRRKNAIFVWSDFMAGKMSQECLSLKKFATWLTAIKSRKTRLLLTAFQIKKGQWIFLPQLKNMIASSVAKRNFLQMKTWFYIWALSTRELFWRRKNVTIVSFLFVAEKYFEKIPWEWSMKELPTWLIAIKGKRKTKLFSHISLKCEGPRQGSENQDCRKIYDCTPTVHFVV